MSIEKTDNGDILITGDSTYVAALLSNWYGMRTALRSGEKGPRVTARFAAAAKHSGSSQRTHAGILVDYTVWLAGYGINPTGTLGLDSLLNQTKRGELARGLKKARVLAAERKAAAK